jgi:hypothetical protein
MCNYIDDLIRMRSASLMMGLVLGLVAFESKYTRVVFGFETRFDFVSCENE